MTKPVNWGTIVSINDFLDVIGIKGAVIMAAFGGAVARIALYPPSGAGVWSTLLSVIGGTLTAVYLGPVVPAYLQWQDNGRPLMAATFIVGLAGMEICKQLILALSRWTPTLKG